jgi:hypothetical protein
VQASAVPGAHLTPTRDEILEQMTRIQPYANQCIRDAGVPDGVIVTVKYELTGANGVTTIQRIEVPPGTVAAGNQAALLRCLHEAFATTCFAPFTQDRFKVSFPFRNPR